MPRTSRRPQQRVKVGRELSHDTGDKLTAALNWYVARDKTGPDYVKAPHYFDAILAWHERLSMDHQDLCATIHKTCVGPGWGDGTAETYAANLPPVPKAPAVVR
jgi:hypothetical protein